MKLNGCIGITSKSNFNEEAELPYITECKYFMSNAK